MTTSPVLPPILDEKLLLTTVESDMRARGTFARKKPDYTGFVKNNSSEPIVYYVTKDGKPEPRTIPAGFYAKVAPVHEKIDGKKQVVGYELNVQATDGKSSFETFNIPETIVKTHAEATAEATKLGTNVIVGAEDFNKLIDQLISWNEGKITRDSLEAGYVGSRNESYFLKLPIDIGIHKPSWGHKGNDYNAGKTGFMLQMPVSGGKALEVYGNDNTLHQFVDPKTGLDISALSAQGKVRTVARRTSLLNSARNAYERPSYVREFFMNLRDGLKQG